MNTAPHIVREMKVLIIKLQGGTARKLECRMWYFMFTESRKSKFRTGILHFNTIDIFTSNGRGGF